MADGKLLLSYLPPDEASQFYEVADLRRYTTNTITDPAQMRAELDQIRSQGFATDNCERFDTGRGLAVPVLDADSRPIVAMLLLGRLEPARDTETLQQMMSLAREMSERLSASGDLPAAAADSPADPTPGPATRPASRQA